MAIDPKSLTVDYKDLLKNTGVTKAEMKGAQPNDEYKKRLASLSPTDIARGLKPDYITKSEMRDAISGDKSKSQAGGGDGVDGGPGGRRRGGGDGPDGRSKVQEKAQLTNEQKQVLRDLKDGNIAIDDPRAKFLNGLDDAALKNAGIERHTDRNASEYRLIPTPDKKALTDDEVRAQSKPITEGENNPRLAASRAKLLADVDKDPDTKALLTKAMLAEGSKKGMQANLEQISNYANARGMTIKQALNSGFFGPINKGIAQRHQITKDEQESYDTAIEKVRAGSNKIDYRIDQGTKGDTNYDKEQHPKYRPKVIDGVFFADHPEVGVGWAAKQKKLDEQYNNDHILPPNATPEQIEEVRQRLHKLRDDKEADDRDLKVLAELDKLPKAKIALDSESSSDSVIETQKDVAGTRTLGIKADLKSALAYAADQTGVKFEVSSGGQAHGKETGSHRHNVDIKGTIGAADGRMFVLDEQGKKRYLNINNPADQEKIEKFTKSFAEVAPAAGVGANYMSKAGSKSRGELFHFGGGNHADDKAVAYAGPDWFRKAHGEGRKGYNSDEVAKKYTEWKIEKERLIQEAQKKKDDEKLAKAEEAKNKVAKAETAKTEAKTKTAETAKATEPAKAAEAKPATPAKATEPAKPAEPAKPETAKPAEPAKPAEAPEQKQAENTPASDRPPVLAQGGDIPIENADNQVTAVPVSEVRDSGGRENVGIMENEQMVAKVNSKEQLKYDAQNKKIDVTPTHKVQPEQLERNEKAKDDNRRENEETQRQQAQNSLGNNPPYSPNRDFINPVVPTDHVLNTSQHRHFERAQFFAGSRHYNHGATNERGGV